MKSSTILILMSLLSAIAFGQIATPPAAGDGSSGNPYQIATLENLYWLSQNSGEWTKHFTQTADIGASATASWDLGDHDNDAGTADEYMGFSPIGDATIEFTGNYDGAGYTISGLTINRPGYDQIGLFGKTNGGIVNNVHIINANIEGKQFVGALVGYAYNETVTRCSTTGTISGTDKVGGLVGYLHGGGGAVDKCFSGGAVSGFDMVGGLFGYFGESPLSDCYSRSSVQGDIYVGGFVGLLNATTATNCYCTGTVTGNTYTGGFNGFDYAISSSCFWDTETSGQNTSPEGTGKTTAEMTAQSTFTTAGWDFVGESTNGTDDVWGIYVSQNNGYPILLGVTPMSLATSTSDASDIAANTATLNGSIIDLGDEGLIPGQHGFVWSTSENPTLNDNKSEQGPVSAIGAFNYYVTGLMPLTIYYVKAYATNAEGTSYGNEVSFITTPEGQGTQANPYLVPDLATLRWLSENSDQWDKYYLQTADIDASETTTWNMGDHDDNAGTPDEYMGFSPIGNDIIKFTGFYDGDGHTIDSMFINRLAFPYIGLFGNTNGATIQNLGMSNVDVVGWSLVGGLVGRHTSGTISNCFSTGNVSGWYQAGGLAGYAEGSSSNISNCYSRVDILGIQTLGGLIGYYNAVTLSNCYSTGNISGSANVGGLLGSKIGGVATASFWDTQTSGTTNGTGDNPSAGITGKTTSEMTTQSTFTDAGWDFVGETTNGTDDIWAMYSYYNDGYPVLHATPQAPAVETNATGSVATTTATLNGNILSLGSENPTQHGFVWNTTSDPTLDDNFSEQGMVTATGAYTHNLTGLLPGKTYYVKAYAINTLGTAYGNEVSFATTSESSIYYIDYKVQSDDFYAQTKESGIFQGNADPVWRFREQTGSSYSAGAWSSWECLYDVPGSQAYGGGKWFNQNTEERWSGSILNNTDNIYIGIEGWEDEDQNYCTYNSGTDENYSSDSYDYHTNLDGTVTRATWENFRNTEQGNVDYVDCGTDGDDNYFKIEFDVWWNYCVPVNPQFSLSDETLEGFTISITGFNNYRVVNWDYQISDDAGFGNIAASAADNEYSILDISGLNSNTTYYVRIRGINEAGTGTYTSAQSIITKGINTWDGSESNYWNVADNWSTGSVPTPGDYVTIPFTTNNPQINSGTGASCIDLTLESGAELTINHGGSLIYTGLLTNNGTINIQKTIGDGQWHLISIPTSGITANSFLGDYLQTWDETVPEWADVEDPETVLNTNVGYALWPTAGKSDYTFTGTPLTGTQTVSVTLSNNFPNPAEGNDGANLLGNPYPSSIDWSGLDDTWGAVYYWNPSANEGAGDYVEWNDGVGGGTQFIPPMHGFFIVVNESNTTDGTGTFTLTNEDRTHSGATGFYKSKIQNGLVLEARSGNSKDEVFIRFKDDATNAFDLQTDALKFLSGVEGAAQIYAFGNSHKLAIDTRPETGTIQLGFANDESGFYSIAMTEADGISKATLEDTKENIFHDLITKPYEFTWNVTDDEKRFKLHLNAVGIEENQISESDILIYAANNQIFIKNVTGVVETHGRASLQMTVSDMMGRVVLRQEISAEGLISVPLNLQTGVYIVTVENGNEMKTEKVFIK